MIKALPSWLEEQLITQYGQDTFALIIAAWREPYQPTLRINTIKANLKSVQELLDDGTYTKGKYSPWAIRLKKRLDAKNPLITSGMVEFQDESSQLAALLLSPKRHSVVVDFCAGSGGKTLLFGMQMRNTGRIYACDTNWSRLSHLKPRLQRSGLTNVCLELLQDSGGDFIRRFGAKADYVFVDAPCSGSGTIGRNGGEFVIDQERLQQLSMLQRQILASASKLVKPGGVLVYATCSIIAAENEDVVTDFLQQSRNFVLADATHAFKIFPELTSDGYLRILPYFNNGDGFFAARLQAKS